MDEKVRLSTLCLLIVGVSDLILSLIWLNAGYGEGNPLFAWLARYGSIPFAMGKIIFLAGPIGIIEFARKTHPRTAELGTWTAVALYMLFLLTHVRHTLGT
jgi:hypothetical protein